MDWLIANNMTQESAHTSLATYLKFKDGPSMQTWGDHVQ